MINNQLIKKCRRTLAIGLLTAVSSNVFAFSLTGTVFDKAGQVYDLDPLLIYSIALVESAASGGSGVKPSPYALRTRWTPHYPKTREEAAVLLTSLLEKESSIDVGMMQVNLRWHRDKVENPTDLLDLETNVMVGAKILRASIDSKPNNLILGIGTYHSPTEIRSQNYGERVMAVYKNLVNLVQNSKK